MGEPPRSSSQFGPDSTSMYLPVTREMGSAVGAAALGLGAGGVAVGAPADLIALPAQSVAEAIAERSPRRLVIKAGRVVARDGAFIGPGSGVPAPD